MRKQNQWSYFGDYKKQIGGILGSNVLTNIPRGVFQGLTYFVILQLSVPLINNTPHNFGDLWNIYYWYLGGFFLFILMSSWSLTNNFCQAYTISTDLRLKLGEKLRNLSLGFFKQNDPGDVTSRMLHDVNKAEDIIAHSLPDIVAAIFLPVMLGAFLLFMSPELGGILMLTVLMSSVFFAIARKVIATLGKDHITTITETSSRILEYARSIKLLKAYDMAGKEFKTLDESMLRLKKLSFRTEVFAGIPVQIALFIMDTGYLVMLALAIKMAVAGSLAIPELFSFIVLGFYFCAPVKQLGIELVLLRHAGLSVGRIRSIMEEEELPYEEKPKLPAGNDIVFDRVDFKYYQEQVLKGINCAIPEKSMTALVGLSGSGKTTMTNLIARFWEIQNGKILLGGVPINTLNPEYLLSQMAMVFQDVYLFNDTIAANIRIGNPNASDEEVKEAARLANCHDFIEAFPAGYDTLVSESGESLSGGEKQRISIARAILKDAPIILLDEATASLDPENEAEIQKALENLVQGKTLVVIAHRFKSIQNADQILVVDQGRIAESGTHDELIRTGGLYQMLWDKQQKAGSWKIRNTVDVKN